MATLLPTRLQYSTDDMIENAPISVQVESKYSTACQYIRTPLAKGRYTQKASSGAFLGIGQIISWYCFLHQWSDEQIQHDCNSDISRGYQHIRVY
jgi:hypothetical protein